MNIFGNLFKKTVDQIEQEQLKRQTESQRLDLKLLSEISDSILSTLDIDTLLKDSIDRIVKRYNLQGGILLLVKGNMLYAQSISQNRAARSFLELIGTPLSTLNIEIKEDTGNLIIESIIKKESVIDNNLELYTKGVLGTKLSQAAQKITGTKSCISIPIIHKNEVLGSIFLAQKYETEFSEEILIFKLITNQLGIAITNARLFKKERDQVLELQNKNTLLQSLRTREKDMMDIMGHELRTPLSIIRLSIGLMQQKLEKSENTMGKEQYLQYIHRIKEALSKEIKLLEAMLTSTKLESERIELHMEKVSVNKVLNGSLTLMSAKAQSKGIDLISNVDESEYYIYGDSVRLSEVFDNIISNAIKYTEKGSVKVFVQKVDNKVNIKIEDTGIGIPKEDIPHLGEKFYRVGQYSNNLIDKKLREKVEQKTLNLIRPGGTGLGLYVSFNLTKLMNGTTTITSKVKKGTTTIVSFPEYNNQTQLRPTQDIKMNIFERLGFTQR